MMRRIPLGATMNLRDLGGYPLPGGGATAWGRILRSDMLSELGEEDIRWLSDRKITTILDLRSEAELSRRPNPLAGQTGFFYHHCPMLGGEVLPNLEADVGKAYFEMLERGENIVRVLRHVAEAPDGVLFHCAAGKDRTGVVAAVLLSLLDIERRDILADYEVTETYIAEMARRMQKQWPDAPAFFGRSKREYMQQCLDLLTDRHGSIGAFLRARGLSAAELERVRDKLI